MRDLEGGAAAALVALYDRGPLLMKDFVAATGTAFTTAAKTKARLLGLGLIRAEAGEARGAREPQEIHLTDQGRDIAAHLAAIRDLLERANKPKRR